MDVNIQVIARMHSDFATKFGIPRQSGLVEELRSTIVFEPEFRNPDALRGIEEFSHLWIIWQFSEAVRQGWSPTVRPIKIPRLLATPMAQKNESGTEITKAQGQEITKNSIATYTQ